MQQNIILKGKAREVFDALKAKVAEIEAQERAPDDLPDHHHHASHVRVQESANRWPGAVMTAELEELLAAAKVMFMAIPAKEATRLLTAVRAVEDSQARIDAPDPHDFDNAGLRMEP